MKKFWKEIHVKHVLCNLHFCTERELWINVLCFRVRLVHCFVFCFHQLMSFFLIGFLLSSRRKTLENSQLTLSPSYELFFVRIEQAQALEMGATKYGAREGDTRGVRSSLTPPRLSTSCSPLFLAYYAQMFCDSFSDASCSGFHQKSGN